MQTAAYANASLVEGLQFEEQGHIYRYEGKVVLSVTQILYNAGLISDFSTHDDYARERGIVVHQCCAVIDEIDWREVDARIMGYVLSFCNWLDKTKAKINSHETRVYNPVYGYAGTFDLDVTIPQFESARRGSLYLHEDASLATLVSHPGNDDFSFFVAFHMVNQWRQQNG